jgi:acyl-CoA synthetase (AMP-forming)/AMP-acid ligase II
MFTVYGLAEASLAVSFPASEKLFKTLHVDRNTLKLGAEVRYISADSPEAVSFVSVGRPVRDCQVKVVDEHSKELAQDMVGHLFIKGDNVTGGYLNNDEAKRSVFDAEGWLDTGDLGLMCDGELVITGRSKDIIFVNGQNYFPHDLESIAQQAAGLELGKVVVTGTRAEDADVDDLLVFVLFRGSLKNFKELATELGRLVNEKTGLEVTHVIPVKRIPKTTSGKIQRHLLEEQYRRGDFSKILAKMQALRSSSAAGDDAAGAIERRLMQICNTAIPDKCIGVHDNLFEIGTSSLVLVEIHEGIEQEFPAMLDISDLFDHPSIAELAVYLEQRMN